MKCADCGKQIIGRVWTKAIISVHGKIILSICNSCYNSIANKYIFSFSGWKNIGDEEMPKATLSYEALQLDSEGIPTEGAYKLKLEGNFKTHIEPIVKFIKATITI